MQHTEQIHWQLICPPCSGNEALPVSLTELRLVELLSSRLNLSISRDHQQRRVYLDTATEYEPVDIEVAAPLIAAYPDTKVSENFSLSEFYPESLNGATSSLFLRLSPKLVETLEEIREQAGSLPLHIVSGYRPKAYNRRMGGVPNSTHIDGIAADIRCDHLSPTELYEVCDRVVGDRGGVGFYTNRDFVHIDLRGYRVRW